VQQVSTADIRDAFARRVDPARMATVIVGADPASVR
jgi:predicted Zn-dependent peptidase